MDGFLERCRQGVLVVDGAMGTELQRAGLEPGIAGEAWMLEHPDRVERIHRAYLDAGADAIITNSFGANRWVQRRYGLADRVVEINRRAAALARAAAGPGHTVLGDVGPCGELLLPLGTVAVDEIAEAVASQVGALLEGGADGIIIETMSAIEEAEAAVRGARRAGAAFVLASLAYDQKGRGARTMMGIAPGAAARALAAAGADAVGANCGTGLASADLVEIVRATRDACNLPVIIQPNAGQPVLEAGRAVYRMTPDEFAAMMAPVVDAGAAIVGGCCGTTPDHIRALAASVRASQR